MSKQNRRRLETLGEALGSQTDPAPPPPAPPSVPERKFLVERETRVPRGSTYYTLPAGKVISSFGYDIEALLAAGVPLTPCSPPAP